jgi:hypothetical protein
VITPDSSPNGTITGSKTAATRFERFIYYGDSTFHFGNQYTSLDKTEMPMDIEVPDLAAGRRLIVQGKARFDGQPTPAPFTVTKTITGVRGRSVQWGNLVGASTVVRQRQRAQRDS